MMSKVRVGMSTDIHLPVYANSKLKSHLEKRGLLTAVHQNSYRRNFVSSK